MGPVISKNKNAISILYNYDRRKRKWSRHYFLPHTKNWFLKNLSEVKIMRNIEKTGTVRNKVSFLGDMFQGSEDKKNSSFLLQPYLFLYFSICMNYSYMDIITVEFPSALKSSFPELFSLHFIFKLICDSPAVLLPSLLIPELFSNSWLAESSLSFSGNGS